MCITLAAPACRCLRKFKYLADIPHNDPEFIGRFRDPMVGPMSATGEGISTAISQAVSRAIGRPFSGQIGHPVSGGCINRAAVLSDGATSFFVKLNKAERLAMFEAEAEGLRALSAVEALTAPQPVCCGLSGQTAFLVLEHLVLRPANADTDERCGTGLALLHRHSHERFGWHRDNTIGTTEQINDWSNDWQTFWRERRIGYQLRLAARQGIGRQAVDRGERLLNELGALLDSHTLKPSLLHGDLWGGNHAADASGAPVIFDPAVYYGDRETDLAMTELFGGFERSFYSAYRHAWPVDDGYATRRTLYNLYHVLNHYNLFGGGYGGQALAMIDSLLAEIR